MKMLTSGFAISLAILATDVKADQMLMVDGEEYSLSSLTENCQSITDDPAAQIACFSALSKLIEEQAADAQENQVSVPQALDALRAVAQYQDADSGLSIAGSDCNIHTVYFNNYFHISRRNVSTIDLFSAQFDASKLLFDQTVKAQGTQAPLSKGFMDAGANAVVRGGVELDSTLDNFAPISARMTLDVYANEVVGQLPAVQAQAFDFVLVHPQRSQSSVEIWTAFEAFVNACK
ncbi:hypothetical protein [Yoonia sp. SS1-5]|uniref:Uncharacterized protein n=2 Tax=Yoonia rhodophyticola TaxID=3137370 RepID=A0AAN0MGD9_9RHOB